MARKRIAISSSGGIAAGAPFVVNQALFVQQASPAVAKSGRFALLNDAVESLIAPATGAVAPNSFLMGEGARAFVGGDRSILLGYQVVQSNGGAVQQTDNILIGNSITVPAISTGNQNLIMLGGTPTFNPAVGFNSYGASIFVGFNHILNNTVAEAVRNNIGLGDSITVTGGQSVVIGVGARVLLGGEAVAIGSGSTADSLCVAVGRQASAAAGGSNKAVAVGRLSIASGAGSVALGPQAEATFDGAIALGQEAKATAIGAMAIGRGLTNPVPNSIMVGSRTFPVFDFFFGSSANDATGGVNYSLSYTTIFGGAGNNLEGNTLTIYGGMGTGNWANAQNRGIDIQCGIVQVAGSTQQARTTVLAMRHSDLNVALWGGLGATMGGGVKVLFIADAVTVPTVAPVGGGLLYVTGGALHWLGSAGTDTPIAAA